MNKKHIGSTLRSLFEETGELEEVQHLTIKKMIADELAEAMKAQGLTITEMSGRMHTSRSAVHRVLDTKQPGLTVETLQKAVDALDCVIDIHIVPKKKWNLRQEGRSYRAIAFEQSPEGVTRAKALLRGTPKRAVSKKKPDKAKRVAR